MPICPPVIERFKASYRDMASMDLATLDELYADNILFKDPVHELKGIAAVRNYFADMMADVQECRFEFLDQQLAENTAYIKWNMHFRHPRLAAGQLLSVRGVSQLHFNERIHYHEDVYDMGAMLYEHIPLFGGLIR